MVSKWHKKENKTLGGAFKPYNPNGPEPTAEDFEKLLECLKDTSSQLALKLCCISSYSYKKYRSDNPEYDKRVRDLFDMKRDRNAVKTRSFLRGGS